KAAAVEYVRVCSTYGAGFFYIPGTETCLRVGGRVRAEYLYAEPIIRAQDAIGFRARGRVQLDARTATAYGLLRTFVRLEITRSTGAYNNSTAVNQTEDGPTVGFSGFGSIATSPQVAQAFIQFGGLTAGRAPSFFVNQDLPTGNWSTVSGFYDFPDVNLLAYTFSFGNGFSASLSLEDQLETRNFATPIFGAGFSAAGERFPDVVGQLKYAGTWGSASLSAALTQIRSNVVLGTGPFAGTIPDSEFGWAVSGQVGVNLPMLAAGDALFFAATYADGALGYLGVGTTGLGNTTIVGNSFAPAVNAFINPLNGDIETGSGWGVYAGLRHYWTPQLRSNIYGTYTAIEYDRTAALVGLNDFNVWQIGGNLIWSPVSGLDIGVEVLYTQLDAPIFVSPVTGAVIGNGGDDDIWSGRLRIQRDF
ncbi:porin, partial [Microvirga sp. BT689]|uniref:porin n=1 Tax=Microvirga arvi TaxID=2778731 RepID=UPI001951FA2D